MRKNLFFILGLIVSVNAMSQKKYLGNGLYWEFYDGVLTISGNGEMPNHSSRKDYPWFDLIYNGEIRKIVIEEGVKSIGKRAFDCYVPYSSDYWKLKEVYLPSTLEIIGEDAFWFHKGLCKVVFGNGLKKIDDCAFQGCISMKEIILPDHLEFIGKKAFERKMNPIEKVRIPLGIQSIGYQSFALTKDIEGENVSQHYDCEVELLPDWLTLDQCKAIGLSESSYNSYLSKKQASQARTSDINEDDDSVKDPYDFAFQRNDETHKTLICTMIQYIPNKSTKNVTGPNNIKLAMVPTEELGASLMMDINYIGKNNPIVNWLNLIGKPYSIVDMNFEFTNGETISVSCVVQDNRTDIMKSGTYAGKINMVFDYSKRFGSYDIKSISYQGIKYYIELNTAATIKSMYNTIINN